MLSVDEIAELTPAQALRELEACSAILPLLIARAHGASAASEWITVREIAQRMKVSTAAVRMRAATDPRWTNFAQKWGRDWRFRRDGFERFAREAKTAL